MKRVEKKDIDKLTCLKCGESRKATTGNFYGNTNPLFATDRMEVCKRCIVEFIGERNSFGHIERVYLVLALLNKPFILDKWEECDGEWSKYIPQVSSLHQHRDQSFKDSDFGIRKVEYTSIEDTDNEPSYRDEYREELVGYWGRGYSVEDYTYLEDEKVKLMSSFECPDYGMEMIMRDICFINFDIEKIRQSDQKTSSSKEISNLIETRSKLMNDAKMKPIQATGADANDQMSFGVLIKKWENEKPIPQSPDDEMKTYIDTFMVGHLAKMEGLNNEMTEKYDQAISEYTINFDELNRVDDYEDE